MRIKNSVRNTSFAFIRYFVDITMKFAVRTVFIYTLGAQYLGLDGLFSNVLSLLSLAELGIGASIIFSMYKPVAENDQEKIKSLISFYKKAYFIIGAVVLVVGLAVLPFLPYIIKDSSDIQFNIYLLFAIALFNTIIGYFFAHKRTIIFAYQRNDIEQKVTLLFRVLLGAAQILILLILKNYVFYLATMPFFTLFDSLLIAYIANRRYPYIKEKGQKLESSERNRIFKNTSALMIHKIGSVVVFATDNIIIAVFLGLTILGYYSNYALVITSISVLLNLFCYAVRSSAGNMIAKEDKDKVFKTFNTLNFLFFWMVGFCAISLITLSQPFISTWIADNYRLDIITVLLLVISFYLTASRQMVQVFKDAAGLFWQDRFKPLVESAINIAASILLVIYWGLPGVVLGTIISSVSTVIWVEPYVLFKHYFKRSVKSYLLKYIFFVFVTCAAGAATYFLCGLLPSGGWRYFIAKMGICAVLPNLIFLLCFFKTESFKYWLSLFKSMLGRKKKCEQPK